MVKTFGFSIQFKPARGGQFVRLFHWDPIVPGQAQLQLPERINKNTYNWEGEMVNFDETSKRINGNKFIFEDGAVNCWGKVDTGSPMLFVDGLKFESRASSPRKYIRNSMFRYGNVTLGDRHILEIAEQNAKLTFVDSKVCPNRRTFTVENPNWNNPVGSIIQDFDSEWGAPFGSKKLILEPGKSAEIEVVCTDISVAYVDTQTGGTMNIFVDNQLKLSQPTNIPFIDTDKKVNFFENRKGVLNLGFGYKKYV